MSDNQTWFQVFEESKALMGFNQSDAANLKAMKETLTPEIPGITDRFYETLQRQDGTKKFVDGRIDALKKTHMEWFEGILAGSYEREFFDRQFQIGLAHVRIGLPPHYVEVIMSAIRADSFAILVKKAPNDAEAWIGSLTRCLDLVLTVINLSYHETRLTKLTTVTGMTRPLLENLILQG